MEKHDRSGDRPNPPEGGTRDIAEDGVDLTLIRWMLSLTPDERLRVLQDNIASLMKLRKARRSPS